MSESLGVHVIPIPLPALGAAWNMVAPFLCRGLLVANDRTIDDVVDGAFDGENQVWTIFNDGSICAAFVTSIMTDGAIKFVDVHALAGAGIVKWGKALSDAMVAHAKEMGCEKVRFVGRRGLLRTYEGVRIVAEHESGGFYFERDAQ